VVSDRGRVLAAGSLDMIVLREGWRLELPTMAVLAMAVRRDAPRRRLPPPDA
jgi:nitrogen fixation protein